MTTHCPYPNDVDSQMPLSIEKGAENNKYGCGVGPLKATDRKAVQEDGKYRLNGVG